MALVTLTGSRHPARSIWTTSTLALVIEQAMCSGFIRFVPTLSPPSGHAAA